MEKTTKNNATDLPLARTEKQRKYWEKLTPVNRPATSDTYKRTMSGSGDIFGPNFACYNLAARKPMQEEGANGRYIMAGIEKVLYPWFMTPISNEEIDEAGEFFRSEGKVDKFPQEQWDRVKANDGYMPIDIYGLPGGLTFLVKDGKHVPLMSVEGPGALVSHLEPQLETIYAPLIQATKARLFYEETGNKFAEFGLRSDQQMNNHPALLQALYVGGGFKLTSDDQAVYLFPEYFEDIGTVGHEFIMAYQKEGRSLEEAQRLAYADFIKANKRSALLPDVISTIESGLPMILDFIKEYKDTDKVILPRFDSGNVKAQCVVWGETCLEAKTLSQMVVEDGYNPQKARETKRYYATAGFNPEEIVVGAGGYFQEGCSRDVASLAYKRSATMHDGKLESSLKYSDSPGKESIPGQIRVYGRNSTLVVAQAGEKIDGEFLSVPLVLNGRIVYNEDLHKQHARAIETWDKYDTIEYSPETQKIINERTAERDSILERYARANTPLLMVGGRR